MLKQSWFVFKPLSAGDWPFLFSENIKEFSFWPEFKPGVYFPLDFYFQATAKALQPFGFSWPWIERIAWFWPFFILTLFSAWFFAKTLFPKQKIIRLLTPLIYLGNTYILMIIDGGQMGLALAYSLAPLVLAFFISQPVWIAALVFSIQIMFDLRLALLTTAAAFLLVPKRRLTRAGLLALLPHLFWLLPAVISNKLALPSTYAKSSWLSFLSTTEFSKALSFLHPYWPENFFGKVILMKPEFLALPILAFGSLLLAKKQRLITPFIWLALAGAFLTKGSNPPFGSFYVWLFNYIPGMNLFRDASKFFLWTALSYSILIPYALSQFRWPKTAAVVFSFYFIFLLQPAWSGQLNGTFKTKNVPSVYVDFKNFLVEQKEAGAVLWVPVKQRFGFSSRLHPAIASSNYVEDAKCLAPFCSLKIPEYDRNYFNCHPNERCFSADASFLANPDVISELAKLEIKYVVIPFDSEAEIFFYERQYDPEAHQKLEAFLDTIPWLKKIANFKNLTVYSLIALSDPGSE